MANFFFEILLDSVSFLEPEVFRDAEQGVHVNFAKVLDVEVVLFGDEAERGLGVAGLVVAAAQDPVENAGVLAETGPEEFALKLEFKFSNTVI